MVRRSLQIKALTVVAAILLLGSNLQPAFAVPGVRSGQGDVKDSLAENSQDLESLLEKSQELMSSGHPIDARAKLQRALQIAPNDYRPHLHLGKYYLFEVGHFKLAYRYLATSEKMFTRSFGNYKDNSLKEEDYGKYVLLLYLLAEARLNLDKYQDSLDTLDKLQPFERMFGLDWYPGTKAWVLMKLKRVDEAIQVAQQGLLNSADPRRTWNILGILLSLKGNRQQSLVAFQEAIRAELTLHGSGMVATPLNNSGEVYRELFSDNLAEASWLRAIKLPDGCEHVLPSLNLAHLYIDELRLHQAERSLTDFEACFAQQSTREDSEHRTLLALARGKIRMHENNIDEALDLITIAAQDQQWFGKIGTNENDVKFGSTIAMAQALKAKAATIRDTEYENSWEYLWATTQAKVLEFRSWWQFRQARKIGFEELSDLEDLFIRNTDTMLEYPLFGTVFADLNPRSFRKRIARMIATDSREHARNFYRLYLATNLLANGEAKEAATLLEKVRGNWRKIDRMAKAETLAQLIPAKRAAKSFWQSSSTEELADLMRLEEELFAALPSHLRFHNLALPVQVNLNAHNESAAPLLQQTLKRLRRARFRSPESSISAKPRYALILTSAQAQTQTQTQAQNGVKITLQLADTTTNRQIALESATIEEDNEQGKVELINKFIAKAFSHQVDPPGEPVPPLPILENILRG